MKNIKTEFTNERIIPASGLAVVGAILGKSDLPFDNSKTKKEGVSRTYKGCDGYAPIICILWI